MIRKRAAERKQPAQAIVVESISVDVQLHALNTFPKAFLVWGILGETPRRPKDMEEKLREHFPSLQHFAFLNRNNFNQYCQRSLKDILQHSVVDVGSNGQARQSPAWRLVDPTIKPAAGFLLKRCAELGVNCEDFMATGRNSCPLSNKIRISLLERLSQFVSQTVDNLAVHTEADTTTIDRHLVKMAAHGLVDYVVPEKNNEFRKRSVKGAYARITRTGQDIARDILRPITSYLEGQKRHEEVILANQPDERALLSVMEIYDQSLHGKDAESQSDDADCLESDPKSGPEQVDAV